MIIKGITKDGKKFRPNDWAQRLCSIFGEFGSDKKFRYCISLRPVCDKDGNCCVYLDDVLVSKESEMYKQILKFIEDNDLELVEEE